MADTESEYLTNLLDRARRFGLYREKAKPHIRPLTKDRWFLGLFMWRFEFKPADCWVGAYWSSDIVLMEVGGRFVKRTDIYACLLPMLPLHIIWPRYAEARR